MQPQSLVLKILQLVLHLFNDLFASSETLLREKQLLPHNLLALLALCQLLPQARVARQLLLQVEHLAVVFLLLHLLTHLRVDLLLP